MTRVFLVLYVLSQSCFGITVRRLDLCPWQRNVFTLVCFKRRGFHPKAGLFPFSIRYRWFWYGSQRLDGFHPTPRPRVYRSVITPHIFECGVSAGRHVDAWRPRLLLLFCAGNQEYTSQSSTVASTVVPGYALFDAWWGVSRGTTSGFSFSDPRVVKKTNAQRQQ